MTTNRLDLRLALPLWAVLLAGCGGGDKAPAPAPNAPAPEAKALPEGKELASEQQQAIEAFARQVEATLGQGDPVYMIQHMDLNAFIDKATEGLGLNASDLANVKMGLRSSLNLPQRFAEEVKRGGTFKLLRVREVNGHPTALYRLVSNGGLNYIELYLKPAAEGQYQIYDCYPYIAGEMMTETCHRMMLQAVAQNQQSLLGKLMQKDSDFVAALPTIQKLQAALGSQQFAQALQHYQQLPDSLKREKAYLLMRITAAMNTNDKEYLAAMQDFRKFHPNDPAADLAASDGLILTQKWDAALAAMDRLEKSVQGDAYLTFLKANINMLAERFEKARELAQKAVEAEPLLIEPHWTMVTIGLNSKNHAEVAEWLTRIRDKFQMTFKDLNSVAEYASFMKSEEGKKWMASQPPGVIEAPAPEGE
ncbi:MAG: hypothetical protein M5U26_26125 [Planctomycetota bacterium]|nr:hypothetical protein [Planctomycetota bacterium]